jgi:SagB-type dehydrogenase family enzyme
VVERVLALDSLAPQASLLRLGATSLDIVRIANAVHAEVGFRPRLAELMRQPTLAGLLGLYHDHLAESRSIPGPGAPSAGATVVDDPAQRAAFKASDRGRRSPEPGAALLALAAAPRSAAPDPYQRYRSVREFARVPVDGRELGALLACLAARELGGTAKYLYGSAGGAYPVQAYLYVKPGRVAGVPGGAHYYDPHRHQLVELGRDRKLDPDAYDYFVNRPVFEAAAFALFLIAELAAIEPLYGEASLGFCQIEAGAMAQLLTMTAAGSGLGLCGIGSVEPGAVTALFSLAPTHRLIYSLVGGQRTDEAIAREQPRRQRDDAESGDDPAGLQDMEDVAI